MGCVNGKAGDSQHGDEAYKRSADSSVPPATAAVVSKAETTAQVAAKDTEPLPSNPSNGEVLVPRIVETAAPPKASQPNPTPEPGMPLPGQRPEDDVPSGFKRTEAGNAGLALHIAYVTQRGFYPEAPNKPNQDSFCVRTQFGGNPDDHFFGVFDGHGEHGTPCSQYARDKLCENLLQHQLFGSNVPQALHAGFVNTNTQMHRSSVDDSMSGTTGISILLRGRTLYAANVGDSRAVLAERRGNDIVAVDLSNDQTPFRADECARVKACGARVLTLDQLEGLKNPNVQCWGGEEDDDGDPPRLWVPNGMYPGTAFTRSLGDTVAERIGVTAVPEVLVLDLAQQHPFFLLASDGVFEFLSSQAVIDMVAEYKDPLEACKAVVAESYRLWLQYETRTDDITIILVNVETVAEAVKQVPQEAASSRGWGTPAPRPAQRDAKVAPSRKAVEGLEEDVAAQPVKVLPPKSAQDLAMLDAAVRSSFLFEGLSSVTRQQLYGAMKHLPVQAGDIVIRQGDIGDRFYVCSQGEFEVLVATAEQLEDAAAKGAEEVGLGTVVHRYSSSTHPCFGDLALLYGTRREATVRAVTPGWLWVLDRGAFRTVIKEQRANRTVLLQLLRRVPALAPLPLAQLERVADCCVPRELEHGQVLVDEKGELESFCVVQQGELLIQSQRGEYNLTQGESLGQELLLRQPVLPMSAVAQGPTTLLTISPSDFEALVGSLRQLTAEDERLQRMQVQLQASRQQDPVIHLLVSSQLAELEWEENVYSTECSEVGRVRFLTTNVVYSMKRYGKERVQRMGRGAQVLRERALLQALTPSPFIPSLLCACADVAHVGLLLQARLAAPLASVMQEPLPEEDARFIAASLVLALQLLHRDGVVCRGLSPDMLLLDDNANLQLVDLRFAKRMGEERTFTLCGVPDYLAPEVILGQGHGQSADWWSLGVLIYTMLHDEGPFGSWRDSELQIYTRISQRQLQYPHSMSQEVVSLLDQLLVVNPEKRLGSSAGGVEALKQHPWFANVPWDDLLGLRAPAPAQLALRLRMVMQQRSAGAATTDDAIPFEEDTREPSWFEGW